MAKPRRKRGTAGDKTICLPIAEGLDYATLVEDREAFRPYLNQQIVAHPERFPEGIEAGYRFHGWVESSRQQLKPGGFCCRGQGKPINYDRISSCLT
jgi:hypothetical protein